MRIAGIVLAIALVSGFAASSAFAQGNSGCSGTIQHGGGQNSCNAWGLCKAYFSGAKKTSGPFLALEGAACSGTQACDSGCPCFNGNCEDTASCVADFCPDTNPGGH
jgi:hypothetical protein